MKSKVIFSLVFVLCSCSILIAQNFDWANQIGGSGSEYANSVKVDPNGNVYTVGNFSGVVDFDPSPASYTISSLGFSDVFLTKYDSLGNLLWVKIIAGINDEGARSVFLDAANNIYITGSYQTGTDFNPGPGTFSLSSGSGANAYVLKLDNSGNFIWVSSLGSSLTTVGIGLSVDLSGNVFVAGSFTGTNSDFDPGPSTYTLSSTGAQDVFVCKLNLTGNLVWAEKIGGSSADSPNFLNIDASANILITGYFKSTIFDLDPGIGTTTVSASGGLDDVFVLKLNNNGSFLWGKQIGGSSYDDGMSIVSDVSGNVYILGNFYDTADMDPGPATFTMTPGASGFADIFITKLDINGNFIWAKQFGGVNGESGFEMALDSFGNIYFTGNFNGPSDFDPGTGVFTLNSIGSLGNYDIFTVKIDNSGNFLWAKSMGGPNTETGMAIAVSSTGYSVLTAGNFFGPNVDFDPGPLTYTLNAIGNTDAFVCRLSGLSTGISEFSNSKLFDLIYPNPTSGKIYFKSELGNNIKSITVTNSLGQIVMSKDLNENSKEKNEMDLSFLPMGIYLLNINGIKSSDSFKLIIN